MNARTYKDVGNDNAKLIGYTRSSFVRSTGIRNHEKNESYGCESKELRKTEFVSQWHFFVSNYDAQFIKSTLKRTVS